MLDCKNNSISYQKFLFLQIAGMDQFTTKPNHLGHLNQIHFDLLVTNLNLVLSIYPILQKKPIHIFVEANLSQDLAAYIEKNVKEYYSSRRITIMFVKQYDSKGKLLPGILTRHKSNLVSYFRRMLNEGKIYIAKQISTVSGLIQEKYKDVDLLTRNDLLDIVSNGNISFPHGFKTKEIVATYPSADDMSNIVKVLVEQATIFRCYTNNTSVTYSGKKNNKSCVSVDDLIMSLILCTAWAQLPTNTYVLS